MMSDDSENDGVYVENSYENDIYYKKYALLLDKCAALQKHNEQLVCRIRRVKAISNVRYKAVQELRGTLLQLGEDWSEIPKEDLEDIKPDIKNLKLGFKIKEEKPDSTEEKPRSSKRPTKRKSTKSEKDPKAPKRPSNPFFQYCQEQRQILMEQLNSELKPGETELTKQELTRQLAIRWKSLTGTDKKVYVDMYERSKEKYAAEMSEYNMKK